MTFQELMKLFLFGGAAIYRGQRCHVIAIDRPTQTVTLREEYTGHEIPNVHPEEVQKYG